MSCGIYVDCSTARCSTYQRVEKAALTFPEFQAFPKSFDPIVETFLTSL